jgi:L-seryl-tRNA(Ser) seleniumtransferase
MKTWVVEVAARELDETTFAQRLRLGNPAVMGRVRDGKLVLDVRTIFPEQVDPLIQALRQAVVATAASREP